MKIVPFIAAAALTAASLGFQVFSGSHSPAQPVAQAPVPEKVEVRYVYIDRALHGDVDLRDVANSLAHEARAAEVLDSCSQRREAGEKVYPTLAYGKVGNGTAFIPGCKSGELPLQPPGEGTS